MEVLREFKGKCRGTEYTYRLIQVEDELLLESHDSMGIVDTVTWEYNPTNLRLLNKACNEIINR